MTPERVASRDGRAEELGVPEGKRRRELAGSRGEAIVDMLGVSLHSMLGVVVAEGKRCKLARKAAQSGYVAMIGAWLDSA